MSNISHEDRATRRRQMAAAIRSGESWQSVLDRFGVTGATLRSVCADYGIMLPNDRQPDSVYKVIALILKGEPDKAIAQMLGFSKSYINQIRQKCRSHGIIEI